jgi:ABC-type branched-subunit amino acid transport system substrate-binding protein
MSELRHRVIRLVMFTVLFFGVAIVLLLLSACSASGDVLPVVKIGLVAPFEGPQRKMAYDILSAAKLAIKQHNEISRATGPLVELVALNDDGHSDHSRRQALQMVADPAILGVLGPGTLDCAAAGIGIYQEARLAAVYPITGSRSLPSAFETLALGRQASQVDLAYDATSALLEAIRWVSSNTTLTRENVYREIETRKKFSKFTDPLEFATH